jgi:hypothetical protein
MNRRVWGRPYRAWPRDRTIKYTLHAYIRLEVGHNHTETHTEYLRMSASTERGGHWTVQGRNRLESGRLVKRPRDGMETVLAVYWWTVQRNIIGNQETCYRYTGY